MTPNHKLTQVIKGRKVVGTSNADGKMTVSFDDGSTMKIKTGIAASDTSSTRSQANATVSNATASNMTPAGILPSTDQKRNDVFRNLRWSGDKSDNDAARLDALNTQERGEVVDAALPTMNVSSNVSANVSSNSASTGGTVAAVGQNATTMTLQFEGGGQMEIPLAEASSSVMLRDKNNVMEYAD